MTTLQTINKPATKRAPHPVKTTKVPVQPLTTTSTSTTLTNGPSVDNASLDSTSTELSANSKDVIVGEQWLVLAKIGEGSFGEVFEARDIDIGRHYAIKRQSRLIGVPQMKHESVMYDVLAAGPGIPQCHWYGQHEEFDCIVIDLLGPSLEQLRQTVFNIPLDIMIDLACQMVCILEHIHQRGLVFRDVKPDNFLFPASCQLPEPDLSREHHPAMMDCRELLERWRTTKLYVVDFGLTTWWQNPTTRRPYPESKKKIRNKTGTARYASLNVHRGKTHARRDDIESLGYLILDLVLGSLPWTGIQARNSKAGWERMRIIKEETVMSDLCAGLPCGLLEFVEYARRLKYFDRPDYTYLKRVLKGCLDGGPFSQPVMRLPFANTKTLMIPHNPITNANGITKCGSQPRPARPLPGQSKDKRSDHSRYHQQLQHEQQQQQQQQYHHHHHHHHAEDVFVMDDLSLELSLIDQKQQNGNGYHRRRRPSHWKPPEGDRHERERSISSSCSSSIQQHQQRPFWKKGHRERHAVGWNSHKRQQNGSESKAKLDYDGRNITT
ncbi:Casein kinase I isoform delta [Apophysomyces ossiformis]|uniref:Casein kinase I isoform delta n=1 Tax=Apophysomyces ossiformis TaxID=679940 RepID=A0A8H7BZV6_9FUNG|nr:Casein kinase I isoform delta [Apophysomyces ossiformis]